MKVWKRSTPEGTYGREYPCVKVSHHPPSEAHAGGRLHHTGPKHPAAYLPLTKSSSSFAPPTALNRHACPCSHHYGAIS